MRLCLTLLMRAFETGRAMTRVLCVFGTRPEAIKMAPVVRELRSRPGHAEAVVCVTGQHREMLDQVMRVFEVRADIDLDLMEHNQTLPSLTTLAVPKLTSVFREVRPDVVLAEASKLSLSEVAGSAASTPIVTADIVATTASGAETRTERGSREERGVAGVSRLWRC